MAKAWRNEAARKINERRKNGSKEGTARQQKDEQVFIAKVWPAKEQGNYLLAGLTQRADIISDYETEAELKQEAENVTKISEELASPGLIASFLRSAKNFFGRR